MIFRKRTRRDRQQEERKRETKRRRLSRLMSRSPQVETLEQRQLLAALTVEDTTPGLAFGPVDITTLGPTVSAGPAPAAPAAFAPGSAPAIIPGSNIEGLDFDDNALETGSLFIPPDPIGARGPDHYVDVVNVSIEWFNEAGVQQFQDSLADFFAPLSPQTFTFDPKVLYDQYNDRFVVVTLEQTGFGTATPADDTSRILLAASDDSDPNGTWHYQAFDSKIDIGGTDYWFDYPGFAVDEEAIYITGNMFTFPTGVFGGSRLFIVDKGDGSGGLYDGGASPSAIHDAFGATGTGGSAGTLQPAHTFGTVPGGVGTWLVQFSGLTDGTDEFVHVIRVDNPLGATTFTSEFINVGDIDSVAGPLPDAPQLGSGLGIEVNDRRTLNAVWRDDALFLTAEILPNSGPDTGETTAHWWELDTTGGAVASLTQQGNIGGEDIAPGTYTYFPAIAVNADGEVGIGFSASAPSIYAGAYYTVRRPGDPAGFTEDAGLLAAGQDYYERTFGGGRNRWGDYSGIAIDPDDDLTFCVFNEYAIARGTPTAGPEDGRWGTRWGCFSLDASISGTKFLDDDGDGFRDPGEIGIPNVRIQLLDGGGTVVAETLTDKEGRYSFSVFDPGDYMVAEDITNFAGLEQTGPQPYYYAYDALGPDLVQIDAATGNVNRLGPVGTSLQGLGLTNAGELYGHTIFGDDFYRIDRGTGAATLIGPIGLTTGAGMSYDAAGDRIFVPALGSGLITIPDAPAEPIPDNDATGITETITVTGGIGPIIDVNVEVDISHTWVGDLEISLTHVTSGTTVVLLDNLPNGVLDCSGDNINATFDDEAAGAPVCNGSVPEVTGVVTPFAPLSAFDGLDPNSAWELTVVDNAAGISGTLNDWTIFVGTPDVHIAEVDRGTGTGTIVGENAAGLPSVISMAGFDPGTGEVILFDTATDEFWSLDPDGVGTVTSPLSTASVPLASFGLVHNGSMFVASDASNLVDLLEVDPATGVIGPAVVSSSESLGVDALEYSPSQLKYNITLGGGEVVTGLDFGNRALPDGLEDNDMQSMATDLGTVVHVQFPDPDGMNPLPPGGGLPPDADFLSIAPEDDENWFKVTSWATGTFDFTLESQAGYVVGEVYDGNGNLLRSGTTAMEIGADPWDVTFEGAVEPDIGAPLAISGNDDLTEMVSLSFPFTFPGAAPTTDIWVSTNGFISIGGDNGSDLSPSASELVNDPFPRVAGLWEDLNPSAMGDVHFNDLGDRAVFSWVDVAPFVNDDEVDFQIILFANGDIQITYNDATTDDGGTYLTGVSPGGGVADPGPTNLSVAIPFFSGDPTVYETFDLSAPGFDTIDLEGTSITFSLRERFMATPLEIEVPVHKGEMLWLRVLDDPNVPGETAIYTLDIISNDIYDGGVAGGDTFGNNAIPDELVTFDLAMPEVLTTIGFQGGGGFSPAGDFDLNGDLYSYYGNDLYLNNQTDGSLTFVGTSTTPGESISGMATDPTNGTVYAVSSNVTTSTLYTVDVTTAVATPVGNIPNSPATIGIAIDGSGQMYGYDIVTDSLHRIDKTSGSDVIVGPLGYDANFAQGMAWDPLSDQIYLSAFNNGSFQAELRIADRTSGNSTLVGALGSLVPGGLNELAWMAIPLGLAGGGNNSIVDATDLGMVVHHEEHELTVPWGDEDWFKFTTWADDGSVSIWMDLVDFDMDGDLDPEETLVMELWSPQPQTLATTTFDSTDVPLAIPDFPGGPINSTLTVDGLPTNPITDVNVTLDIEHTFVGDLEIFLISPSGTRVELTTDNDGGDNFTGTTFDDESGISIVDGIAPYTGTFRPETPLSDLDLEDPNGVWTLEITDDAGADTGTLNSWSLEISTGGPLAVGIVDPDTFSVHIENFPADKNEMFLLRVAGDPIAMSQNEYSFSIYGNDQFDAPRSGLYVVDTVFSPVSGPVGNIFEIDPDNNGAVLRTLPVPEPASAGPDGLAFDGEYLYFINGFGITDPPNEETIYTIDPVSGAVVNAWGSPIGSDIDALAADPTTGSLYAMDFTSNTIHRIDISDPLFGTGAVLDSAVAPVDLVGGIGYHVSRGTLYATVNADEVVELSYTPTTPGSATIAVVNGPTDIPGFAQLGVGLIGTGDTDGRLFAADFSGTVYELDPTNLAAAPIQSFPAPAGLPSAGAGGPEELNVNLNNDPANATDFGMIVHKQVEELTIPWGDEDWFKVTAWADGGHIDARATLVDHNGNGHIDAEELLGMELWTDGDGVDGPDVVTDVVNNVTGAAGPDGVPDDLLASAKLQGIDLVIAHQPAEKNEMFWIRTFSPTTQGPNNDTVLVAVRDDEVVSTLLNIDDGGFQPGGQVLRFDQDGNVIQIIDHPAFDQGIISDVEIGKMGDIFVSQDVITIDPVKDPADPAALSDPEGSRGQLLQFDAEGNFIGYIPFTNRDGTPLLDNDAVPPNAFFYPFGFDAAPDGTFWITLPNSNRVAHVDAMGKVANDYQPLTADIYNVGAVPEEIAFVEGDPADPTDDRVYIGYRNSGDGGAERIDVLDPNNPGALSTIIDPVEGAFGLNFNMDGNLWFTDHLNAIIQLSDPGGTILDTLTPADRPIDAEEDWKGNVWTTIWNSESGADPAATVDDIRGLQKFDSNGVEQFFIDFIGQGFPIGLAVASQPIMGSNEYTLSISNQDRLEHNDFFPGYPTTSSLQGSFTNVLDTSDPTVPSAGNFPVNVSTQPGPAAPASNQLNMEIAVNTLNPDNLAIGSSSVDGLDSAVDAYWSMDGGHTWMRTRIDETVDGFGDDTFREDASVEFDRWGNLYLSYRVVDGTQSWIVLARSTDGGASFGESVVLDSVDGVFSNVDNPFLTVGPDFLDPVGQDNVYVTWTVNGDTLSSQSEIRFAGSPAANSGGPIAPLNFALPGSMQLVSDNNTFNPDHSAPAVGPAGEVYVTWVNQANSALMFDVDPDGLGNIAPFFIDTQVGAPGTPVTTIGRASIDADRSGGDNTGRVYIAYQSGSNINVIHSDDPNNPLGPTWVSPIWIATVDTNILPQLDVDQDGSDPRSIGDVNVVYYNIDGGDVVASTTRGRDIDGNGVVEWGNYFTLAHEPSSGPVGNYIGVASHGGAAFFAWADNSTNPGDLDVFFNAIHPPTDLDALVGMPDGISETVWVDELTIPWFDEDWFQFDLDPQTLKAPDQLTVILDLEDANMNGSLDSDEFLTIELFVDDEGVDGFEEVDSSPDFLLTDNGEPQLLPDGVTPNPDFQFVAKWVYDISLVDSDEEYYLRVFGGEGMASNEYDLHLKLGFDLSPDDYEPNDIPEQATILGSLPKITLSDLTLHETGVSQVDEDWFKYTAQDTGKLILNAHFVADPAAGLGDVDMEVWVDTDDDSLPDTLLDTAVTVAHGEQLVLPVITQEMYWIHISTPVVDGHQFPNCYTLEIENFPTPEPDFIDLVSEDDSGMMNDDNVTNVANADIVIEADLGDFANMGITLLGAAEADGSTAGAAVEVFVNGESVGFADPIATTTNDLWSYQFADGDLAEGDNLVKAAVVIFDGVRSDRSQLGGALVIFLDTVDPAIVGSVEMLDASDSGDSNTDNITNKMQPAFTGTGEANAKIRIYATAKDDTTGLDIAGAPRELVGQSVVTTQGDWEITVEPLVDGHYNIYVEQEDLAGNISLLGPGGSFVSTDTPIAIPDNTIPGISSTISVSGLNDVITQDVIVTIDTDHPFAISDLDVTLTSPDLTPVSLGLGLGSTEFSLADFLGENPNGDWTLSIDDVLVDDVGSLLSWSLDITAPLMIWVDASPPQRPTIDLVNDHDTGMSALDNVTYGNALPDYTLVSPDATMDFVVTAEPGARVLVKDGNTVIETIDPFPSSSSRTVTLTLGEGTHLLSTEVIDDAGNVSHQSDELIVTVDTTRPDKVTDVDMLDASDTGPNNQDNITSKMQPAFSGTGEPNNKIRIYAARKDDATGIDLGPRELVGQSIITSQGDWEITVEPLADGHYNIYAEQEDLAGNISMINEIADTLVFTNGDDFPIPDATAGEFNSIVDISPGTTNGALITNVEVDVSITHTDPTQLDVRLVHPNGTTFVPITNFTGTAVAFANFNGLLADGDWTLEIDDNVADGITGTLNSWNLRVVTDAPADLTLPGTPAGAIPDATAGMTMSSITVDVPLTIDGLVVTPQITHPRLGDLMAWVTSPASTRIMISPLDGTPLSLTDFNGEIAAGDWKIEVQDKVVDEAGTLTAWTLGFEVTTSELMIWIDAEGPQRPTLNLENADDTGMSNLDNVTFGDPAQGDGILDFFLTADAGSDVLIKDGNTVINGQITDGGGATLTTPADFDALDLADGDVDGIAKITIDFNAVETAHGIPLDGDHLLSAETFDDAGNRSAQSDEMVVTIDTIAPPAITDTALAATSDSGATGDNTTNKMQPAFVGTAEPNAKVRVYAGGVLVGEGVATSQGDWEITVEPLVDGVYTITTEVEDLAGNITAGTGPRITVDGTAPQRPTLDLQTLFDTGMMNDDNVTSFGVDASEIDQNFDGGELGNLVPFTVTAESQTGTTILIKDGNTVINDRAWVVINDSPFELVPINSFNGADFSLLDQNALDAQGDASPDINGRVSVLIQLDEGTHLLSVEATDAAGNISHQSEELVVTIDRTAPPRITSVDMLSASDSGADNADNMTNIRQPAFAGVGEPNAKVRVLAAAKDPTTGLDTGAREIVGQSVVTSEGDWEITVEPLIDGHYNIYVEQEDLAGNISLIGPGGTFVSSDVPVAIPEDGVSSSGPADSTLDVSGLDGLIVDVNVTLDITHTFVGDLDIFLISPSGTAVELTSDNDGGNDFTNTTFDDEALISIVDGSAPYSGTFRPEGLLSDFDGEDPNGTWTLQINDDALIDVGVLNSWSLDIVVPLMITVDATPPQRPTIDLVNAHDSGMSDLDNVTFGNVVPAADGNDATMDFVITAEAGATVVIKDGNDVEVTINDFDPTTDSTQTLTLSEGTHLLSTEVTDAAGNISHQSQELIVTVDTTRPAKITGVDMLDASDTGDDNQDNITSKMQPAFAGTGEPNAKIRIYAASKDERTGVDTGPRELVGQSVITSQGDWEITVEPLADGHYNIYAEQEDLAGNVSMINEIIGTVDFSNNTVTAIPDATPGVLQAPISVSSGSTGGGTVTSVIVDANITHADPSDLTATLTLLEEGTGTPLHSEVVDLTGSLPLTFDTQFDGQPAAGNWVLELNDNEVGDVGTLSDWTINVFFENGAVGDVGTTINFNAAIPDASAGVLNSTIDVDVPLNIDGVVLTAQVTHPAIGDVMAWLNSPAGTRIMVSPLDGSPLTLTDFDGENAGGQWTLEVQDKVVGEAGTLDQWALGFQVTTSELMIWIDSEGPQRPTLNLENADDTGMSNLDNVTSGETPGVMDFFLTADAGSQILIKDGNTVIHAAVLGGAPTPADFDTIDGLDGSVDGIAKITIDFNVVESVYGIPLNGDHPLSVETFDDAGNRSAQSEELLVTIDTIFPAASDPSLTVSSDSGNPADAATFTDNKTNKMQPSFTGTAEANAKVRLYAGGVLVGQTVATSTGDWEITSKPLVDGVYTITTEVEDLAGNITSGGDLTITIDGTAPQRPTLDLQTAADSGMSDIDNVTNDPNMVPFTVTSESAAGTTIVIKDGNTVIFGPTEFDTISVNNQATVSLNLDEGTHLLSVESTDMAGNISHQSEELVVTIDRTAPEDNVTIALAGTSQSGTLGTSVVTSKMQPAFVGSTEPNAKVRLYAVNNGMLGTMPDRVQIGEGVANSQGDYEITVEPLVNGHYIISVDVEDLAGNITMTTATEVVVVDPLEPNNSVATATHLGSEPTTILRDLLLHDETDTDLFSITAHMTGKMVIDVGGDASSYVLTWHDSNGALLVTDGDVATDADDSRDGKLVVPVVGGETYLIQVNNDLEQIGQDPIDTKVSYDLEVENFMAPVPTFLVLNPADDTGVSNSDNVTNNNNPEMFIQVDLNDFEDMGIVIDSEGNQGADVQVTFAGISDGTTFVVDADRLAGNLWTATLAGPAGEALDDDLYFVNARVVIEDHAGEQGFKNLSVPTIITIETVNPPAAIDLIDSSDSGMLDDDEVTNVASPTFSGSDSEPGSTVRLYADGTLVGVGQVQTDGTWTVTADTLADGRYDITVTIEDQAGNFTNDGPLEIEIDTLAPNTAYLDLIAASDSGRHDEDNITNDDTPTFTMSTEDRTANPDVFSHMFDENFKFRLFVRPEAAAGGVTGEEILLYDSAQDGPLFGQIPAANFADGLTDLSFLERTVDELPDGYHNFKLEVEDRAGNISHDYLLDVVIDTTPPDNGTIALDPSSDSGILGVPATMGDNLTNDSTPKFVGSTEADAVVTVLINGQPGGTAVAVPIDGNDAFPPPVGTVGNYMLQTTLKLADGDYTAEAFFTDVAGNVAEGDDLPFGVVSFSVDTSGPTVTDVFLTDNPDYDLFDPKPSTDGPTPATDRITIKFTDTPMRSEEFLRAAVNEDLAAINGMYQLTGDHSGNILITDVIVNDLTTVGGVSNGGTTNGGGSGAVIIDGGDRWDHGSFDGFQNVDGWQYIEQMVDFALAGARNGATNDILAVGITTNNPEDTSLAAIQSVASALGADLTVVSGSSISTVNFNNYKVLYVPGQETDGGNLEGINPADHQRLVARKADVQSFVNNGGSLVAQTEEDIEPSNGFTTSPYGWLELPLPFQIADSVEDVQYQTQALIDAGLSITNAELLNGTPLHNSFVGPPGFNGLEPFVYNTGNNGIAESGGGDDQIVTLGLAPGSAGIGGMVMTEVTLVFGETLPDDRYTLTVDDALSDDAGNALDGESQAGSPGSQNVVLPSGDGQPGGDFVARFTIDSRPEIATWSQGVVYADINGNQVWDPEGQDNDATNRDFVFNFGEVTDAYFTGNFGDGYSGSASGFDKLGTYGNFNGVYEFVLDAEDHDGVEDTTLPMAFQLSALPVAGDFDPSHPGDEVGAFDGQHWYLDVNADPFFNRGIQSNERFDVNLPDGLPVVGDFNGDGVDDLATLDAVSGVLTIAQVQSYSSSGPNVVGIDTIEFNFSGFGERPVAGDVNLDGVDDIVLWVPGRQGQTPDVAGEFHFLVSDREGQDYGGGEFVRPSTLFDPYSPEPLGNDLVAQFGDEFALPLFGNFDPPVGTDGGGGDSVTLHNELNPLDTNMDGEVTTLDALVVVNALNGDAMDYSDLEALVASWNGYRLDASQDGVVTAFDALKIINALDDPSTASAEAESATWAAAADSAIADLDDDDDDLINLLATDAEQQRLN